MVKGLNFSREKLDVSEVEKEKREHLSLIIGQFGSRGGVDKTGLFFVPGALPGFLAVFGAEIRDPVFVTLRQGGQLAN